MHRRNFLQMTLGTAAVGMLPLPAMTAPVVQAARPMTYAWAVAIAHAQAKVSEGALVSQLGVTPETARATMARLLERGIISAPDAGGVARAVAPMLRSVPLPGMRAVASVTRAANATDAPRLNDLARQVGDVLTDDTEPGASDDTPSDGQQEA